MGIDFPLVGDPDAVDTAMQAESAARRYGPEPSSASSARRFVMGSLDSWAMERFCDDAALCTAELATNAILHARTEFTVAVRRLTAGVRIDVQDDRPDRLPDPLPPHGRAIDPAATGRGLMLIAGVATRWGYFNTDVAKTVWIELGDRRSDGPAQPMVEITERPDHPGPFVTLMDVPVRAAIASGAQVDDLLRQLQLSPGLLSDDDRAAFYRLLERSAGPRLTGRHEAFRAAGQGLERYTFELPVSPDEASATMELTRLLHHAAALDVIQPLAVEPEVEALRRWLAHEVAAQHRGAPPTPYPG